MSTSTACEQFFDIPELPRLLTAFLNRKDVSRLARTNRKLNSLCTPSLYWSLERSFDKESKIWESLPALLALARNVQHNPGLTLLDLTSVPLLDLRGGRMFARTLAGLSKLKNLSLTIHCRNGDWIELWNYLFFRFPSSIQGLLLNIEACEGLLLNIEACEGLSRYQDALNEVVHAGGWKGAEVEAIDERQEPLIHLESMFFLGSQGYQWDMTKDLCAMFAHCPNLKMLNGSINVADGGRIEALGHFIAEGCPKIEELTFGVVEYDERLPIRIMSSLPAQQVVKVDLRIGSPRFGMSAVNLAIHQHSTTLRVLLIEGRTDVIWFSVATILKECLNLEILRLPCKKPQGLVISLDDVLEHPWACSKLKRLALAIGGCEIPYESDVEPYYRRPTPITLDEVETEHLSRLEDLYKRIGSLTALEELDLKMVPLDEDGEVDYDALEHDRMLFPAMLNLPDPRTGMPGFLHHLAGLEKLKGIRGSVWADIDEAVRTIDWMEVTWMDRHWPLLRYATVYPMYGEMSAPFKWLRERRADGKQDLWLEGIP
ncbi:MAG: hypothetical protein JOS17DRAFT_774630 [Linnemannia elongata]|nr:MAG: hypothetical protein JOS17DRAFT_774630 [Linnemannia elongata]